MASPDENPKAKPTETPRGGRPNQTPPARAGGPNALIGLTISERYKIERLLGEGGMGAVYQAEHTLMRKRMAIKVLHPEMTRLPEVVARFEREAMAAAHIEHPNVVTATDFGKLEDGSFFLALEFVEGGSLRDLIAGGRIELGRALHIARQIASALGRAHQLKIVHRDLKPENVMLVTRDGDPDFVKVLDFGIAKVQIGELASGESAEASPGQPVLTQAGMVYGTPEYMAPEQALGQPVDARADLYALGIIMYEMICGVRPFEAGSKVALLGMHVTAPVPPMETKAPGVNVPPEVEALVKKLLAKEATERTNDAKEVIDGIGATLTSLVAAGRIGLEYAPPPGSRLGTNPGLVSAIGPAPDLAAVAEARGAASGGRPAEAPAGQQSLFAGNKQWIIAAVGGMAGILVLVFTIAFVVRGGAKERTDAGSVDAEATAAAPQEPPLDQKVKDAIALIESGAYAAGIDAIGALPEAQGREDVHRALLKAYAATNRPKDAVREASQIVKLNPNADLTSRDGIALRTVVRDTALQDSQPGADKAAVDEAFGLLKGGLGPIGFDDLYDIAHGPSRDSYPKARDRARAELLKADRSKMSPAVAVAVDLHAAGGNCAAIKALLERAGDSGDERTLVILKGLAAPRIQGHWKKVDLLGCIHEGSLTKATAEVEARVKRR